MAEEDGFLGRWSRRKQAQKAETAEAAEAKDKPTPAAAPAVPPPVPETIDLAKLPPIESLTAESDFSVFLKPGVPDGLRLAALRKLWLTEPSIRNYEALVDYAWDFNAPGYGKLLPTDDVEKMMRAVFGESEKRDAPEPAPAPASEQKSAAQDSVRRTAPSQPAAALPVTTTEAAVSPPQDAPAAPKPRRHGAALPRGADEGDPT